MSAPGQDWWTGIRAHFAAAALAAEAVAPQLTADDVPMDQWAENREALGIHHQSGDIIGLSETDDRSGFPSWREHRDQAEVPEPTAMDEYAATRTAYTSSSVFGCPAPTPRRNTSPWTSDGQPR
jgi:hypothetical protein